MTPPAFVRKNIATNICFFIRSHFISIMIRSFLAFFVPLHPVASLIFQTTTTTTTTTTKKINNNNKKNQQQQQQQQQKPSKCVWQQGCHATILPASGNFQNAPVLPESQQPKPPEATTKDHAWVKEHQTTIDRSGSGWSRKWNLKTNLMGIHGMEIWILPTLETGGFISQGEYITDGNSHWDGNMNGSLPTFFRDGEIHRKKISGRICRHKTLIRNGYFQCGSARYERMDGLKVLEVWW